MYGHDTDRTIDAVRLPLLVAESVMPSVSSSAERRRIVASRCAADTNRKQTCVATVRSPDSSLSSNPNAMDTSTSDSTSPCATDFALSPVDELQGIARRLLADRASIAAYCASLGTRISSLVKQVGESAVEQGNSDLKEQNIRWHHLFPVASDVLNDNVAKYVAARSSNARKEVSSEPDAYVLYDMFSLVYNRLSVHQFCWS
jgi:hypothetical protein